MGKCMIRSVPVLRRRIVAASVFGGGMVNIAQPDSFEQEVVLTLAGTRKGPCTTNCWGSEDIHDSFPGNHIQGD